jgi:DNA-nicking Smr family endonuclease
VDARIDLHGLRQDAAHHRLRRFLVDGQDAGHRLVLVITGKGSTASPSDFGREERGVLKRSVPAWLDSGEFRPFVAGYDVAGPRHGGSGALYVRIRRKRR